WLDVVSPDYFPAMNIPTLAGRRFTDADTSGSPVALITAATARRFFPHQDAVGKHIRLLDQKDWRTIVGVIPDVRAYDLERNVPDWITGTAYVPYNASATLENREVPAEMSVVVRTTLEASQVAAMLRRTVAGLSREVPVTEVKAM